MVPMQCRAGRAALNWSVDTLAAKANVAGNTVSRFENGDVDLRNETARRIMSALEAEGVRFRKDDEGHPCVCLTKPNARFTKRPPRYNSLNMVLTFEIEASHGVLTVVVPRNTLNDKDSEDPHAHTEQGILNSFERLRARLLRACQSVLETEPARIQPDGRLYLTVGDII